jgi:hypothetical protein
VRPGVFSYPGEPVVEADVRVTEQVGGDDVLCTRVHEEHEDDFKSVKKFNVFNTNNLWMSCRRVVEERTLDMEIIVNPKQGDVTFGRGGNTCGCSMRQI